MNRFEKIALAAAILFTALIGVFGNPEVDAIYRSRMDEGGLPLWNIGYLIATYGPMAIGVCFWRLSKQFKFGWILHILFLPCAVAAFRGGEMLMLSAIGDPDFDAMMGAGIMPAILMLVVTIGIYIAALTARFWPRY